MDDAVATWASAKAREKRTNFDWLGARRRLAVRSRDKHENSGTKTKRPGACAALHELNRRSSNLERSNTSPTAAAHRRGDRPDHAAARAWPGAAATAWPRGAPAWPRAQSTTACDPRMGPWDGSAVGSGPGPPHQSRPARDTVVRRSLPPMRAPRLLDRTEIRRHRHLLEQRRPKNAISASQRCERRRRDMVPVEGRREKWRIRLPWNQQGHKTESTIAPKVPAKAAETGIHCTGCKFRGK